MSDDSHSRLGEWISDLRTRTDGAAAAVDAIDADVLDSEVGFAAEHVRRYIATKGADDGWQGPRPIVILYTRGRKTGKYRRHPLLCFEHDGARYVIGSKGGAARDPVWFTNLLADPQVHVRMLAAVYSANAIQVSGEDRARLWPLITERFPMFAEYQRNTEREIPLVRLEPA